APGMAPGRKWGSSGPDHYHDHADMRFFRGPIDIDSVRPVDRWVRRATYPLGIVSGARRQAALSGIAKVIPPESAVFHDTPWSNYTVLEIADSSFGGASGLEHQNSHVDVIAAGGLDSDFIPSLYAHEIFHSWNVKRLRP